VRLYHTTDASAFEAILQPGFQDKTGSYGFVNDHRPASLTGVWFANRPLGVSEGAADEPVLGAPVLVIDVDEEAVAAYELTTRSGTYREWCIPAELANHHLLGVIYDPLDDRVGEAWWEAIEPLQ
jgi:hypothetical protein